MRFPVLAPNALSSSCAKCAFQFLRQMRFQVLAPRPHARRETICTRTMRFQLLRHGRPPWRLRKQTGPGR
jgi:hypothetical protein